MRTFCVSCIIFMSILSSGKAVAQSQEKAYALMLINFAKGIFWPEMNNKEFIIGVLGYEPLLPELIASSSNISIHGRKIKILNISSPEDSEKCHIVFIPAYKAKAVGQIVTRMNNKPALIVTNKLGQTKIGSSIDLILRDGKLTYDINCKSIEARGMKISSAVRNSGRAID